MTAGLIIFAVMVAVQAILFIIGGAIIIACLIKDYNEKSDKLYLIASIIWGISPLFSMIGVFFGVFL